MIKGAFATVFFLFVFGLGVNFALLHPKVAKELMNAFGYEYPATAKK